MGFTTWPFGPNLQDVNDTYSFIEDNSDIYVEHIDNKIPWNAWMNDLTLPTEFTGEIAGRKGRKISENQLLLSVSILSTLREDLVEDFDGNIPSYTRMNDSHIEDAYFKHIDYLVGELEPDYLVIAIEVNELRLHSPEKWDDFTSLIASVKSRVKAKWSGLPISESVSLHNLYEPGATSNEYVDDMISHMNQMDFVAISFYPYLKNLKTRAEMQAAFDFLHNRISKPIAFAESGHIAENLVIPNLSVSIDSDPDVQNDFLEVLIENAEEQNYEFIAWWAHKDFDALWETFPEEVKDLGQIWRDTGLIDENGSGRPSFSTWQSYQSKAYSD